MSKRTAGPDPRGKPRLVVAVVNQKGGVGKTTVATNLAAAGHLAGHRTLLIDLDSQGSALDWYAQRCRRLEGGESSKLEGLAVVKVDRPMTAPMFAEIADGYSCVVLDGPPRLDRVTRAAAALADVVVIPVGSGPFDVWAAPETLASLEEAQSIRLELGKPPTRRLFLINRVEVGGSFTRELPAVLEGHGEVLEAVIYGRTAYKRAAQLGESVLSIACGDRGRAARDFAPVFGQLVAQVAQ